MFEPDDKELEYTPFDAIMDVLPLVRGKRVGNTVTPFATINEPDEETVTGYNFPGPNWGNRCYLMYELAHKIPMYAVRHPIVDGGRYTYDKSKYDAEFPGFTINGSWLGGFDSSEPSGWPFIDEHGTCWIVNVGVRWGAELSSGKKVTLVFYKRRADSLFKVFTPLSADNGEYTVTTVEVTATINTAGETNYTNNSGRMAPQITTGGMYITDISPDGRHCCAVFYAGTITAAMSLDVPYPKIISHIDTRATFSQTFFEGGGGGVTFDTEKSTGEDTVTLSVKPVSSERFTESGSTGSVTTTINARLSGTGVALQTLTVSASSSSESTTTGDISGSITKNTETGDTTGSVNVSVSGSGSETASLSASIQGLGASYSASHSLSKSMSVSQDATFNDFYGSRFVSDSGDAGTSNVSESWSVDGLVDSEQRGSSISQQIYSTQDTMSFGYNVAVNSFVAPYPTGLKVEGEGTVVSYSLTTTGSPGIGAQGVIVRTANNVETEENMFVSPVGDVLLELVTVFAQFPPNAVTSNYPSIMPSIPSYVEDDDGGYVGFICECELNPDTPGCEEFEGRFTWGYDYIGVSDDEV